jgi:hypothetical protein
MNQRERDNKAVGAALDMIVAHYKQQPADLRMDFLSAVATVSISLLHGTAGKEFTRGFLQDAMRSLDDPSTVILKEPLRH